MSWLSTVNNGWSKEVSIRVSWHLDSTTVEQDFRSISFRVLDDSVSSFQSISSAKGNEIGVFFSVSDSKLLGSLNDLWNPVLCFTNHDGNSLGHASLSGGSEAGTDHSVDGIVLIGVGHNNSVVLSSHVRLNSATSLRSSLIDVLSSSISSNE